MMTTIKQGIITFLVSFAVFFFMPVLSYASENIDVSLETDSVYSFNNVDIDGLNSDTYVYSFSGSTFYKNSKTVDFYSWNLDSEPGTASRRAFYLNNGRYEIYTISGGYVTNYDARYYRYRLDGTYLDYISTRYFYSYYTNDSTYYPVLQSTSFPVFTDYDKMVVFLQGGSITADDIVNAPSSGPSGSPSSLGYIKPSYYLDNHVGSSGDYEIITWSATSTTGVDLTDSRYNVQFALRDKSYTMSAGEKAKINFDTYPNMVEGIGVYLGRKIYNFSQNNVNNAILRGDVVPMSTYNNMVSLGITSASSRRFAFNAMNEYSNSPNFQAAHPEIAANLNNVINANVQEFIPGGFLQRIFNDSNLRNLADFQLSYDIYARITDSQSGTKGNWLLIDKHGRPVKDLENVLNGGSTIRPVKVPDFEPTTDFTTAPDDEDIPDEELDDNDTVKDEPLPTGYIDPSSGDGVTNYYNYTYNYDNRTWIENHYDNQTVEEVNEGLEWIKMFPGFFGLFLKFFGAFLPGWAVVCVTIAIPIIIGLLIFKAIKGVIPFV